MKQLTLTLTLAITGALLSGLHSEAIPLHLPRPDGKPGNPAKPVKVYILASQSNMVGMGDISGAQPEYPLVYLSSDPAIISGQMPIGASRIKSACKWEWRGVPALRTHGVCRCVGASRCHGAW